MKTVSLSSALLRASSLGVVVISAVAVGQSAKAAPPIQPIYQTNFIETSVNAPAGSPTYSFGYFFDTNKSYTHLNAIGFPFFQGWADSPGSPTQFPFADKFDVYVWRIKGIDQPDLNPCNGSTQYCQIAKVTFDQKLANTYKLQNGYYWQDIPPVDLGAETASKADIQYATAAVGNFNVDSGLPTLVGPPNGGGLFDPVFTWTGNGLNADGNVLIPDYSSDFPVPWNYVSIPDTAEDPETYYAYFSPNLSYALVPSPLPLLGAGTAFGWARRMRRRVQGSTLKALGCSHCAVIRSK